MSELAEFVRRGATKITPQILRGVYKKLPLLKVGFAEMFDRNFPHLPDQLHFLTNLIEDFADGRADEVPYVTIASAVFAVIYAKRQFDLIPDTVSDVGIADDSSVVRIVLIENERVLAKYAEKIGTAWSKVTVKP